MLDCVLKRIVHIMPEVGYQGFDDGIGSVFFRLVAGVIFRLVVGV